ncbi:hypothetical protein [Chelativorans sp. M5D2P16]|uniref:hypothetical protein n=1 Tax=Chelativorans sp. M5D2P16 TaxID=3095678 RepID=UPI002ACA115B|nr:hypothetical protein [Chelativorans sp. M5D2P16]MDZ5696701.1 hypothetical protein [Chelativorans sp. M5D2P16]
MPEGSEYPRSMRQDEVPSSRVPSAAAAKGFVLARWRGEALSTVFWRDMLLAGSLINLIAALGAVALLASKAPLVVALLLFFTSLPMNLFLFIAVWRCGGSSSPLNAYYARLGATIWLIAATAL